MKKKKKICNCQAHKESKLLLSLKNKLTPAQHKTLTTIFENKWYTEDELCVARTKLEERWPGYKLKKALKDMYDLKWFDNLTYIELLEKARNLE
jgi:hypothetical protein